jgi:hypothetical protein
MRWVLEWDKSAVAEKTDKQACIKYENRCVYQSMVSRHASLVSFLEARRTKQKNRKSTQARLTSQCPPNLDDIRKG